MERSVIIYITVNKNGSINLSLDKPIKNNDKWIINDYFCNSTLYKQMYDLIKKSEMSFDSEPEVIEINLKTVND